MSSVAIDSGNVVGVSLTRRHFRESAELHLIAVELSTDGCMLLSVHSVGASFDNEPHDHTRAFPTLRASIRSKHTTTSTGSAPP